MFLHIPTLFSAMTFILRSKSFVDTQAKLKFKANISSFASLKILNNNIIALALWCQTNLPSSKGGAAGDEGVDKDSKGPQVALGTIILLCPVKHIDHLVLKRDDNCGKNASCNHIHVWVTFA